MCQKAEGESNYLLAVDRSLRKQGHEAFHAGVPRDQNPEPSHKLEQYSHAYQWDLGWLTAAEGRETW